MKLFHKRTVGVSKKYAVKAALFRRLASNMGDKHSPAFSRENLIAHYQYESLGGTEPDKKTNGYAAGKFMFDITVSNIIESIKAGEFLACEFTCTAINRLHYTQALADVHVDPKVFFAGDRIRELAITQTKASAKQLSETLADYIRRTNLCDDWIIMTHSETK